VNRPPRIGIYGGTFDPIHRTHLDIARSALDYAQLDRILFVVAANPPHKRGEVFADAEDRFALVAAAVADEPRMEASRIELDRGGISFTADTLRTIHEAHAGADLYLIIGFDSLVDFPGWWRPDEILQRARLLVVPRPGVMEPLAPQMDGRYELLPFRESEVSSTDIRRKLAAGESLDGVVPDAVLRLIHEKGLYHGAADSSAR
jgi:nicotinate-nucleotide adenylyltransferase